MPIKPITYQRPLVKGQISTKDPNITIPLLASLPLPPNLISLINAKYYSPLKQVREAYVENVTPAPSLP